MPNDFVANWLCLLGRLTLLWARVDEPQNDEEKRLYRLVLGLVCLFATLTLLITLAVVAPHLIKLFFQLGNSSPDMTGWTTAAGWTIHFLIWLLASPLFVGSLYGQRTRRPKRFYMVTAASITCVSIGALLNSAFEPLMLVAVLPIAVALCPEPERLNHKIIDPSGRRPKTPPM